MLTLGKSGGDASLPGSLIPYRAAKLKRERAVRTRQWSRDTAWPPVLAYHLARRHMFRHRVSGYHFLAHNTPTHPANLR